MTGFDSHHPLHFEKPVISRDSGFFLHFQGFSVFIHLKLLLASKGKNAGIKTKNANKNAKLAKLRVKVKPFRAIRQLPRAPPTVLFLRTWRKMIPFSPNLYRNAVILCRKRSVPQ